MMNIFSRKNIVGFIVVLLGTFLMTFPTGGITTFAQPVVTTTPRIIRTFDNSDLKVTSPAGLAFSTQSNLFHVVEANTLPPPMSTSSDIIRITPYAEWMGTSRLGITVQDPTTVTFDNVRNRMLVLNATSSALIEITEDASGLLNTGAVMQHDISHLELQDPQGITVEPVTGHLFVLDAAGPQLIRVEPDAAGGFANAGLTQTDLRPSGLSVPRGLAYDPSNASLITWDSQKQQFVALSTAGMRVNAWTLDDFTVGDDLSMTFAPTSDVTDDPALLSLFVVENKEQDQLADSTLQATDVQATAAPDSQIIEISFLPQLNLVSGIPIDPVSLQNVTQTSGFSPPSPDPSGLAYLSFSNSLMISDGEVNEMPQYFTGDNLFETSLAGNLIDTFTTIDYSNEPTGIAYNPANNFIYTTDDTGDKGVFEVNPGLDGVYSTGDDIITYYDLGSSSDPEGVAYGQGKLYVSDGANGELFTIDLGPNGVLNSSDSLTQFDTDQLGLDDPEGVEYDPDNGHLYILSSNDDVIAEIETDGTLLRYLDISSLNAIKPAGLAYAPASGNPSQRNLYIVDRAIDNGPDPDENDGVMFEISYSHLSSGNPTNTPVPTATNTPLPTATNTPRPTATNTPLPTATNTPLPTATNTPLPTATNTPLPTATNTPLPTATNTPLPTATNTPLPTATNTPLPTATNTPLPTATNTPLPTATNTPLPTATNTPLPTATNTPLPTATNTPLPTATNTPLATATNTPLATATNTPLPTATNTPLATATNTPLPTATNTPLATATNTPLPTATNTPLPTATNTPLPTATNTPLATATNTPLPTATNTPLPTATNTPLPTATNTPIPPTDTATPVNTATPTSTPEEPGGTFTFTAVADAAVLSNRSDNNYGTASGLAADGSPVINSYLRFDVQELTGNIDSVTLRLWANSTNSAGVDASGVTDNSWSETGITYNNAPAAGAVLGSSGATSAGTWSEIEVTSFVTGEGLVSFMISTADAGRIMFDSREAANAPELVIVTVGGSTPTPTDTPVPPTATPTASATAVPTNTPTVGPSPTPTNTSTVGPSPTPTDTPVPPTATATATASPTPEPGAGETIYVSATNSGTAGSVPFDDEDVLAYDTDSGTWAIYFDGSDLGITLNDLDAFYQMSDGSLLLSFVRAQDIGSLTGVDDSDIVRFIPTSLGETTAGTFEMYLDGSDVGLASGGEDVDAIGFTPDGRLLISTLGTYSTGNVSGAGNDLLVLDGGVFGDDTSGTWAIYFDGEDVELTDSGENISGVWVAANGDIYLATSGAFAVTGAAGDGADIFVCTPGSLGSTTSCTYSFYWDGSAAGLGSNGIDGFFIEQ